MKNRTWGFIVFFLCAPAAGFADTLHLKSGRTVEGVVQSETQDALRIQLASGAARFSRADVLRIERSSDADNAALKEDWKKQKAAAAEREKARLEKKAAEPRSTKVTGEDGQIFVDTLLNGKVRATLLLDTGAQTLLITDRMARKLGISPKKAPKGYAQAAGGRTVPVSLVTIARVQVDKAEARDVLAAVLPPGVSPGPGAGDGLLGMSFLKHFNLQVDYARKKITLQKSK